MKTFSDPLSQKKGFDDETPKKVIQQLQVNSLEGAKKPSLIRQNLANPTLVHFVIMFLKTKMIEDVFGIKS